MRSIWVNVIDAHPDTSLCVFGGRFLITGLLAGAPELVLARLGLETVIFLLEAYEQKHQNWLWPDWGLKW